MGIFPGGDLTSKTVPDGRRGAREGGEGEDGPERVKRGCRSRVDKPRGTRAPLRTASTWRTVSPIPFFPRSPRECRPDERERVARYRFPSAIRIVRRSRRLFAIPRRRQPRRVARGSSSRSSSCVSKTREIGVDRPRRFGSSPDRILSSLPSREN